MMLRSIWTVFRFECRRTGTWARLIVALAIALFPVGLLLLIRNEQIDIQDPGRGAVALFVLIPEVVCIMCLLLWAAPLVSAELEGKTWVYLATSPAGKGSILLGKYLTAVTWTIAVGWLSTGLSVWVIQPAKSPLQIALTIAGLVVFSTVTYGALYTLLGVVFLRRALVAAVGYTFVSEVLVGFVPALINQFSAQYHFRSLLIRWLPSHAVGELLQMDRQIVSDSPAWQHIAMLLAADVVLLVAAILIVRRRELVLAESKQ